MNYQQQYDKAKEEFDKNSLDRFVATKLVAARQQLKLYELYGDFDECEKHIWRRRSSKGSKDPVPMICWECGKIGPPPNQLTTDEKIEDWRDWDCFSVRPEKHIVLF